MKLLNLKENISKSNAQIRCVKHFSYLVTTTVKIALIQNF